jgi:hypothetical protein
MGDTKGAIRDSGGLSRFAGWWPSVPGQRNPFKIAFCFVGFKLGETDMMSQEYIIESDVKH